jgi:hypothetical protein
MSFVLVHSMKNVCKLIEYGTQDEEKQYKNTTQYVLDTIIRKQTQITYIRHEYSNKQLVVKTNRFPFLCGNHKDFTTRNPERKDI